MATKRQRRNVEVKKRKKKKGTRLLILSIITVAAFGFLIFLFVTLFDFLYPPVTGKGEGIQRRKAKWGVTLYFSDANERFLVPEKRQIVKDKDTAAQVRELVRALLDGSQMNHVNTFPQATEVQNVRIEDGKIAHISFNANLIRNHPGGSSAEMATIYSLTDTVTANIPSIKEVKLLVDGKEMESIGGHIDTRHTFTPDNDMIISGEKTG